MYVEIVAGHCQVQSRTMPDGKGGERAIHDQPAYLWMPGAPFPLPFVISLRSAADVYAPGEYVFSPESVRTNNFQALEFNRFNMRLLPAKITDKQAPKAVNS
jgi:hypothetical protein